MSDTTECSGGIKDKEEDFQIVPFTIVSLLFYSVFFFFFFLFKPYNRGYLHIILHRVPKERVPRRRPSDVRAKTLVLWSDNKTRSVIDEQPMKFEKKKAQKNLFDVNGRGWIRYIIENELQRSTGHKN